MDFRFLCAGTGNFYSNYSEILYLIVKDGS